MLYYQLTVLVLFVKVFFNPIFRLIIRDFAFILKCKLVLQPYKEGVARVLMIEVHGPKELHVLVQQGE